jgi:hypothetical protein
MESARDSEVEAQVVLASISIRVRPLMIHPSVNIRQIRTKWVAKLIRLLKEKGWNESKPKVYVSVPFQQVKSLSDQNDAYALETINRIKFKVIDGAHRIRALRILVMDPTVLQFDVSTRIIVEVVPEARSAIQRSLDDYVENTKHESIFARKTFADDLWNMIGTLIELVRRVIAFSWGVSELSASTGEGWEAVGGRVTRGSARKAVKPQMLADASKDPNLPIENPAFIAAYFRYLDKYLVSGTRLGTVRRPFDPKSLIDMELLKPVVILALARASFEAQSHEYLVSENNEFVKVKWRILCKMLPFHIEQIPLVDDDDARSGGSGLHPRLDQDRR